MLIITAPVQGTQTPGFPSPPPTIPGAAEQTGAWSDTIQLVAAGALRAGLATRSSDWLRELGGQD